MVFGPVATRDFASPARWGSVRPGDSHRYRGNTASCSLIDGEDRNKDRDLEGIMMDRRNMGMGLEEV